MTYVHHFEKCHPLQFSKSKTTVQDDMHFDLILNIMSESFWRLRGFQSMHIYIASIKMFLDARP